MFEPQHARWQGIGVEGAQMTVDGGVTRSCATSDKLWQPQSLPTRYLVENSQLCYITLTGEIPDNLSEPYEENMASANGMTILSHVVEPKRQKLISQRLSLPACQTHACKSKVAGGNFPGGGLQLIITEESERMAGHCTNCGHLS